jgi:hypothetical protein
MRSAQTIASVLLYLVAAVLVVFGVISQVLSTMPPHWEGYTGLTTGEHPPLVLDAILILVKAIGFLYIGMGLALAVLTAGPLRRGDRWAHLAIAVLVFPLALVSVAAIPFLSHGLFGPQTYGYALAGLTAIALALSMAQTREARPAVGK